MSGESPGPGGEGGFGYHVLVQKALLLECFPEVALELLVVWNAARCVCGGGRWGNVFGHCVGI